MQIPTNPMYDIDEHATVRLISTGCVIPEYINHKKRRAVKIRGISHKPASRPLDRLLLSTFKPLPPDQISDWWSVKFEDNDRQNLDLPNISWDDTWYKPLFIPGINCCVGSWIQVEGHPSLEIRVTLLGADVRDYESKKILDSFLDVSGYRAVRIAGSYVTIHRLLALTFLPHPVDTDHLTVNHKDSDKDNNSLVNLEWATYTENNAHAFDEGLRSSSVRKIKLLNLETGAVMTFPGHNGVARYLGVKPGSVHSVMDRRTFEGRPYKGHILKYSDDHRSWTDLRESGPVARREIPNQIACRNMDTGDVCVYDSVTELERNEGINRHALLRNLMMPKIIPYKRKCFLPVPECGNLEWPEYPDEILSVYEKVHSSDKPIMVTDSQGIVRYYPSISSWCEEDRENRCDPAVLSRFLKKKDRWRDWVFELIDLNKYMKNEHNLTLGKSHSPEMTR